jgi:hypothetical protein
VLTLAKPRETYSQAEEVPEPRSESGRILFQDAAGDPVWSKYWGLREVVWVFLATSERWKHACEHLEPQIFLVA